MRFLLAALVCLVPISCSVEEPHPIEAGETHPAPARAAADPNVVVITIDTLRADALGAYGNALGTSPVLDRIASEGVLFEQCASAAPSTLPSHASIFTGRFPYAHGARANGLHRLAPSQTTLAERLQAQGFATGAEVAALVLARITQLDQGFDHYRDTLDTSSGAGAADWTLATRPAADITAAGIQFIRRHREQPFFLWLHYFDPHDPYAAPDPYDRRFAASPYHGEVAYVDAQIGHFVDALSAQGLVERTLLVITSDHGEGLGEHGEQRHMSYVYESTMRVPCILRGRGLPPGRRVSTPIRTVDLAPTVLDWLDLPALEAVQGSSVLPLIDAVDAPIPRLLYGESSDLAILFGASTLRFARIGSWKYIHKPRPALYDLDRDPGELVNLAGQQPDQVARLRERLAGLLEAGSPRPESAALELDPKLREGLQALGYAASPAAEPEARDQGPLALEGPDADALVEDVNRYAEGRGRIQAGHGEQALAIFEDLQHRFPTSSAIFDGYLQALELTGHEARAEEALDQATRLWPERRDYHDTLVRLNLARGDRAAAEHGMARVVERWPCDDPARMRLARFAAERSAPRTSLSVLEGRGEDCPASPVIQNELAWLLATSQDAGIRDGARALELARQALAALPPGQPLVLDTLAAAHAEVGDLAEAMRVSREAVALAERQGLPMAARSTLNEHLELLEAGRAIRE